MRNDEEDTEVTVGIIALTILIVWLLSASGYLSAYLRMLLGHA